MNDTRKLFQGDHYHCIRNYPEYRMLIMVEEMRLNMEPAWAQPGDKFPEHVFQTLHTRHIHTHQNESMHELKEHLKGVETALSKHLSETRTSTKDTYSIKE